MPAHPLSSDQGLKDAAVSTLRELLSVSKRYRARRLRLDALFLFDERSTRRGGKLRVVPKASVDFDDAPEMELILKHRDVYESLGETIRVTSDRLKDPAIDADSLAQAMALLIRLENTRDKHLLAIQEVLGNLSRELMAQENVLARVVAEGAKLAQMAQINETRIDALLQTKGAGLESRTTTDLMKLVSEMKQRIADGEEFVVEDTDGGEAQG